MENNLKDVLELARTIKKSLDKGFIEKEFITSFQLREFLSISSATLIKWRKNNIIPYHKIDKKFYYKYSEIIEVLDKYKVPAR